MDNTLLKLEQLRDREKMRSKGPLCVALHVTRVAIERGLPIDVDQQFTSGGGQIKGLGKGRVQSILKGYGITRVLAAEGGRTSRGSIGIMKSYVAFLNELNKVGPVDLNVIESWWVEQVKVFFASKPFKLKYDTAKSYRAIISDLLTQAERRQNQGSGTMWVGTLLQHLVGAKIDSLLGKGEVQHHGASVADSPTGRPGDFLIDDISIHVTAAPGEVLIRKCADNINSNFRPVIITLPKKITVAEELAAQNGLENRIDVFDIEQFLAANVYELSRFSRANRKVTIKEIVENYNHIVTECESDPGLKIDFA
ncbi:DUF4928 family protein [Dethiosulfatarculus sandiegensis]|uniref:DUF4928 domain-containing protein n=1 Tax=Dethiosulfatarculus sandiegensis TaxID=1429043 RepID=A0A0D2JFU1_9BACT|nr:DUF4928 family protein [Dethiosulfatarculus sandiegensis]KIX14536.1 hypothetical protein X474_08020 [Dethiosulfatarculus sandiegensis]